MRARSLSWWRPAVAAFPTAGPIRATVRNIWWREQDSNLRRPFGRRFYRPVVLATHPSRHDFHLTPIIRQRTRTVMARRQRQGLRLRLSPPLLFTSTQMDDTAMEPKGGFEPPTCRLQIGCAANCATWARLNPKPKSHLCFLQLTQTTSSLSCHCGYPSSPTPNSKAA